MEPRFHVPAGDGIERPGEQVAKELPHVAVGQHFGTRLFVIAGRHVAFEGLR